MSLNYTIQKRRDQRADNQQGKSFTELLLGEWKNLSSSNLKEWVAQAQKVDDAEFTALLDEEWEEFSATKKETLAQKARQETARQKEALVQVTQAAEKEVKKAEAALDQRAAMMPRREAEKKLRSAKYGLANVKAFLDAADAKALLDAADVAEAKVVSDAADVEAARARERVKEVITRVSGGSGAATPTPTPMPTSPTATANGNGNGTKSDNASDKKDWAFNERAEVERAVRKEWRELLAKGHTCKSFDRTRWEQRAKARVAG